MTSGSKMLAEAIATFALVFVGAGAVIANGMTGGSLGILGVALAHGLVLMVMIFSLGHISGTHANPAVTISLVISRKMKPKMGVLYVVSQLAGASIAGFLLLFAFSPPASLALGAPALAEGVSMGRGILIEAILTFFLVLAVFGSAIDRKSELAGLAIGMVLTFDILAGGFLTGAAMNPARSFGPALASGFWQNHLVYWVGPLIGGAIAGLLYSRFLLEGKSDKA